MWTHNHHLSIVANFVNLHAMEQLAKGYSIFAIVKQKVIFYFLPSFLSWHSSWIFLPCNFFQENDPTLTGRVKKSDAREMRSFYQHYYRKYIQALTNAAGKANRSVSLVNWWFHSILRKNCYLLQWLSMFALFSVPSFQRHIKLLTFFLRCWKLLAWHNPLKLIVRCKSGDPLVLNLLRCF